MIEKTINITQLANNPKGGLSAEERSGMKRHLADKLQQLGALAGASSLQRVRLQLDIAEILNPLERKKEAWDIARDAFVAAMQQESWQDAVEACDVLYQAEQADSIAVLGMGIWLGAKGLGSN